MLSASKRKHVEQQFEDAVGSLECSTDVEAVQTAQDLAVQDM